MQQLLHPKGFWKISVEAQLVLTKQVERFTYWNKLVEDMGLIGFNYLDILLFRTIQFKTLI